MTRFARAKGSKASNERAPEDATPWAVMKEQMQQAKQDAEQARGREQAEKQRQENYQNFLNERKTEKRKSTWCDFPSDQPKITYNLLVKKSKTNVMAPLNDSQSSYDDTPKKKKLQIETNIQKSSEDNKVKKKEKGKKNNATNTLPESQDQTFSDKKTSNPGNFDQNLQKKKKIKNIDKANHSNKKNNNTIRNHSKSEDDEGTAEQNKKQKKGKQGKNLRRKHGDNSFQIIINGRQVELVRIDGFPVMKKDAERLEQLKQDMAKKGIPKKEIDRTMKLQRRRAEKALARIKRDVCYNCRKGGHNLSDCPDLRSRLPPAGDDINTADTNVADAADGVCFKCGSAEHRAADCRVHKGQQFRFASCFICKEQGHIARQCPDNPKGMYPKGGCCKLCGDVTHLRKDCPTTKTEKEESTIKLSTLASADSVEAVADAPVAAAATGTRKPKKIVF